MTAVSNLVWVCWKAMIEEKTIKEEWTNKNYSNDNYRTTFCGTAFAFEYLPVS